MTTAGARGRGAYGLRLSGVAGLEDYLVPAPHSWVPLELRLRVSAATTETGFTAGRRAEFMTLSGARVALDLDRGRATLTAPRTLGPEEIVHPCLSSVGAMAAYLQGHETFHAAAAAGPAGAWAIVGDRESGKSSTLAALATMGIPIVCDDTLVLRGTHALAGPRSIDLRRDAAERLGVGENLGVVGTRERWRLRVGPVDAEVPLRGWLFLEWSVDAQLGSIASSERLHRLLPQRGVRLPPADPSALLELARLPAFVVRRPRDPSRIEETAARLAETIAAAPAR